MEENDYSLFLAQFKSEVSKSLIMDDTDKEYWLINVEKLPKSLVHYFYKSLKDNNDRVEMYIKKAVDNDPSLVTEMKNNVKGLKQRLLKLKEKSDSESGNPDEILEEDLKNLVK